MGQDRTTSYLCSQCPRFIPQTDASSRFMRQRKRRRKRLEHIDRHKLQHELKVKITCKAPIRGQHRLTAIRITLVAILFILPSYNQANRHELYETTPTSTTTTSQDAQAAFVDSTLRRAALRPHNITSLKRPSPPYLLALTLSKERQTPILKPDHVNQSYKSNASSSNNLPHEEENFLGRFSSTVLLETLLKYPQLSSKSPFSSLSMSMLKASNRRSMKNDETSKENLHGRQVSGENVSHNRADGRLSNSEDRMFNGLHTAPTNLATILDHMKTSNEQQSAQTNSSNNKTDLFNASSLNYLVERLLRVDSFKQPPSNSLRPKRPALRTKLDKQPSQSHSSTGDDWKSISRQDWNHSTKDNQTQGKPKTLDALIRDEYNSRVEPMLQSLLLQQRLSNLTQAAKSRPIKDSSNRAGPSNHRTTDVYSLVSSTTLDPVNDDPARSEYTSPQPDLSITKASVKAEELNHNTLVDFEDLLDLDADTEGEEIDEEEDQEKDLAQSQVNANNQKRPILKIKTLSNVPPYQFSSNFGFLGGLIVKNRTKNDYAETQSTTSSTANPITFQPDNKRTVKINSNSSAPGGDRDGVASIQGSMVFSDGAEEAARSRLRKQNQMSSHQGERNNLRNKIKNMMPHVGESIILDQLFSTLRPPSEAHNNMTGQNYHDQDEELAQNPLVYSGYVGKDDYVISTTPNDWSRPIANREVTNYPGMRYPTNVTGGVTRRPFIEVPTTDKTYFEQPTTNAQSVPLFVALTTPSPMSVVQKSNYTTSYSLDSRLRNSSRFGDPTGFNSPRGVGHPNTRYSAPVSGSLGKNYSQSRTSLNHGVNKTEFSDVRKTGGAGLNYSPEVTSESFEKSRPKFTDRSRPGDGHNAAHNYTDTHYVKTAHEESNFPTLKSNVEVRNSSFHKNTNQPVNLDRPGYPADPRESAQATRHTDSTMAGPDSFNNSMSGKFGGTGTAQNQSAKVVPPVHNDTKSNFTDNYNSQDLRAEFMHPQMSNQLSRNSSTLDANKRKFKPLVENQLLRPANSDTANDYQMSESDQLESSERDPFRKFSSAQNRSENTNQKANFGLTDIRPPNVSSNASLRHDPPSGENSIGSLEKNYEIISNEPNRRNVTVYQEKVATQGVPPNRVANQHPASTSTGSAVIPGNFFGEASSESPMFVNSIPISGNHFSTKPVPSNNADLHQRIGSSTSDSSSTTNNPNEHNKDISSDNGKLNDSSSNLNKTSGKSNDRMAFILIGGSCALSVVCLVLAAMSMRCQDMCDDYRSLRNAEKAAMKLQKHRMKYTKNHQVSHRIGLQSNSLTNSEEQQLNEFRAGMKQNNVNNDANVIEQPNNSRFVAPSNNLNNQPIQHFSNNIENITNSSNIHERSPPMSIWPPASCQNALNALPNKDTRCGCANCLNNRWLAQSEFLTNSKHLSLLHPYYFMQNQSRLRPPFGAGSSVGAFFPRRLDDHTFLGGSSSEPLVLVGNQPQLSCHAGLEQRGLAQSKSFLQKSKRLTHRHSNCAESFNCDITNHGCTNPNHSHVQHSHQGGIVHKYDLEPSASDESEITIDDSICCEGAKCSATAHHQSRHHHHHHTVLHSCLKSPHLKQTNHNRRSTHAKAVQAHHHHTHHHSQQPPSSSSDNGSIVQCTCNRDQQPLIGGIQTRHHSTRHKLFNYKQSKHDRASVRHHNKRDKSLLVWSTNRDQLI